MVSGKGSAPPQPHYTPHLVNLITTPPDNHKILCSEGINIAPHHATCKVKTLSKVQADESKPSLFGTLITLLRGRLSNSLTAVSPTCWKAQRYVVQAASISLMVACCASAWIKQNSLCCSADVASDKPLICRGLWFHSFPLSLGLRRQLCHFLLVLRQGSLQPARLAALNSA